VFLRPLSPMRFGSENVLGIQGRDDPYLMWFLSWISLLNFKVDGVYRRNESCGISTIERCIEGVRCVR
jgi:hypothetical protein